MTRRSPSRKAASPWRSKISSMVAPAAASISASASMKGILSRCASRRPMLDLPAPISPTSATVRGTGNVAASVMMPEPAGTAAFARGMSAAGCVANSP